MKDLRMKLVIKDSSNTKVFDVYDRVKPIDLIDFLKNFKGVIRYYQDKKTILFLSDDY